MDRDRSRDAEEEDNTPSKADLARAKLKIIARYVLIGFAPVVSVAALIIGVIAISNTQSQSDRTKLGELESRIDSLNANLSETKSELENLKFTQSREKAMRGDEHKKLDEQDAKIIQSVTLLQTKLKVSPTLEEQLRAPASSPASVGAAFAPAVAPVSPAANKTQAVTSEQAVAKNRLSPRHPNRKPLTIRPTR